MSGVGGELTESEEILSTMREVGDEVTLTRAIARKDMKCREVKKLAAGASLL